MGQEYRPENRETAEVEQIVNSTGNQNYPDGNNNFEPTGHYDSGSNCVPYPPLQNTPSTGVGQYQASGSYTGGQHPIGGEYPSQIQETQYLRPVQTLKPPSTISYGNGENAFNPNAPQVSPKPSENGFDTLGKVLIGIIVVLSLLIVIGVIGGVAYYQDWFSLSTSQSTSDSKSEQDNVDEKTGEENHAKANTEEDQTQEEEKTEDQTQAEKNTEDQTQAEKNTEDDDSNLNIPPKDTIEVKMGVRKLNDDATDPFSVAIEDAVIRRDFTPNEHYEITVYSTVIEKNFMLKCVNPSSKNGWVHCTGIDTRGDVQVWVKE